MGSGPFCRYQLNSVFLFTVLFPGHDFDVDLAKLGAQTLFIRHPHSQLFPRYDFNFDLAKLKAQYGRFTGMPLITVYIGILL